MKGDSDSDGDSGGGGDGGGGGVVSSVVRFNKAGDMREGVREDLVNWGD